MPVFEQEYFLSLLQPVTPHLAEGFGGSAFCAAKGNGYPAGTDMEIPDWLLL